MWHSHKEKGEAYVWHLHKDNGDTQDICVTFTQRKVGQLHSEEEAKRCGSPHKISVIYETKGNKELIINETAFVWQS